MNEFKKKLIKLLFIIFLILTAFEFLTTRNKFGFKK